MRRWVLLRGLIRHQRHWESFPEQFQRQFPEDQLHLVDLPGNGRRYQEDSPTQIEAMVNAAREQLAELDQRPVHLLALSLGGMVAVDWMHRFPAEVSGAVIINSSLSGVNPLLWRFRPQQYPRLLQHVLFNHSSLSRERMILRVSSNLREDMDKLARHWANYDGEQPTSTSNALRQLVAAARYRAPAQRPHDNVLLLASKRDRVVDWRCSNALAQHWQWPLVSHPKAGHDLTLDDAPWVIQQIDTWINAKQ